MTCVPQEGSNIIRIDGVKGCAGQVAVDGGQIRLAFENDINGILALVYATVTIGA